MCWYILQMKWDYKEELYFYDPKPYYHDAKAPFITIMRTNLLFNLANIYCG
jgi:hypothetical protein